MGLKIEVSPIIQSLWIGEKLSVMEQLSISSFLQNGHSFHLYVYDEVEGVPKGTVLKDANEIIPSGRIFKYKHWDSYAGFADLFRYKLLLEKGGYWVDTDVVCLKPFQFEADYMFTGVPDRFIYLMFKSVLTGHFAYLKRRYHISTWFIKAPIGCEMMGYCYSEAAKRDPEELVWGEIGPRLITTAVEKFGMQKYVAPRGTFYPIRWWQWRQLVNGSFIASWKWKRAMHSSYAVHLYNEMWRRNNIDKNASFPQNSIYEQLKHRYLSDT